MTNNIPPDASNQHLVAFLRIALGENGWSMQRLAACMRWKRYPEWLEAVTELAFERDLIKERPRKPRKNKPKTAKVIYLPTR
jgi:hypothetical protein